MNEMPSKFSAAVFYGPGQIYVDNEREFRPILVRKDNDPTVIEKNFRDTVLKVRSCCVCGYDARVFRNGHRKVKPPIILGHEICAETIEDTPLMSAGTRVAVYPVLPCMRCRYCHRKMYNLCTNMQELGSTLDGGFAEYVSIPKEIMQIGGLLPVPDSLSDNEASLIEPLACCLNGVSWISQTGSTNIYRNGKALQAEEKSVAIIGDGPIGLMHLQLFKNLFRTKPILIGKISERMNIAQSLGAERTFFSDNTDATVSEILQFSGGPGYDLVVVASSDPSALELATMIASKGSTISIFAGIKEKPAGNAATLDPNIIHYNQISVIGSFSSTPDNFKQAIQIATARVVDLSKIVTRQCSLDEISQALFLTGNYKGLRTAIIP